VNRDEHRQRGRAERKRLPRRSHAGFLAPPDRPDPLVLVDQQNRTRLPTIVPVRWGRMAQSPFGWLRGSPVVMAADLAGTPTTSLDVQLCGDAHLLNFGLYGAPDRRQVFDVNDFDETLEGPFEWDVKRLAASAVVAARTVGLPDQVGARAARAAAAGYRTHMARFAAVPAIDVWYDVIDVDEVLAVVRPERARTLARRASRARQQTSMSVMPRLAEVTGQGRRLRDRPPLVRRLGEADVGGSVHEMVEEYRRTVTDHVRPLVERYEVVDVALKVVGVGSVGTRCFVTMLDAAGDGSDLLFLQVKEAIGSVLEPHLDPSPHATGGERVVRGQRRMQAASDILLGWFEAFGHSYYVRQLRDMKAGVDLTCMAPEPFVRYCGLCGWVLARAHARTGDPGAISGYLGKGAVFDEAMAAFATDYATVAVADHARLVEAVAAGEIETVEA
jgi:uncharacterized protein (DUF2252 family)